MANGLEKINCKENQALKITFQTFRLLSSLLAICSVFGVMSGSAISNGREPKRTLS